MNAPVPKQESRSWRTAALIVAVVGAGVAVAIAATSLNSGSPAPQATTRTATAAATVTEPITEVGISVLANRAQKRFAIEVTRRCRRAIRAARATPRTAGAPAISEALAPGAAKRAARTLELMALRHVLASKAPKKTGRSYGSVYGRYLRTLGDEIEIEARIVAAIKSSDELSLDIGRHQNETNGRRRTVLAEELGFGRCLHGPSE